MSTEPAEVVSATVELTYADGRVERIVLDNTERARPIVLNLDVSNDVVDATPPDSAFWVRKPGDRRSVYIQMAGRGPVVACTCPQLDFTPVQGPPQFVRGRDSRCAVHEVTPAASAGPIVSKEPQ